MSSCSGVTIRSSTLLAGNGDKRSTRAGASALNTTILVSSEKSRYRKTRLGMEPTLELLLFELAEML